jgi:hypothetical protein
MIRWKCTNCGAVLRAPVNAVGKQLPCPACKDAQTVPKTSLITSLATTAEDTTAPIEPPKNPVAKSSSKSIGVAPQPSTSQANLESSPASATTAVNAPLATSTSANNQNEQQTLTSRKSGRFPLIAASSLLLLLVFGITYWQASSKPNSNTSIASSEETENLTQQESISGESTEPAEELSQAEYDKLVEDGLIDDDKWKKYRQNNQVLSIDAANTIHVPAEAGDQTIDLQNVESLPLAKSDFYSLATMASQFYRQNGKISRLDPAPEQMGQLRKSKNPRTQALFKQLDDSLRRYVLADSLKKQAADLEAQAFQDLASGLFASDGNTWVRTELSPSGVERIETLSDYYTREAVATGFQSFGNRADANMLLNEADAERLSVWKELEKEFGSLSTQEATNNPSIRLAIVRSQKTEFEGPIELWQQMLKDKPLWIYGIKAFNESERELQNVVLSVTLEAIPSIDGLNPQQIDEALKEPNLYFIPKWPAKSSIDLLTGNQWGSDCVRRSVKGTISLWSESERIDQLKIDFDDNLLSYAGEVLVRWNQMLDHGDFPAVLNHLSNFRNFVPSRLTDLHQKMNEVQLAAENLRQKLATFKTLLAPESELKGTWSFGKFSDNMSLRIMKNGPETRNAINADQNSPANSGSLTVELFQTEQPAVYRRLAGTIFCNKRQWQVQLEGQMDSGNRGFEKTGTAPATDFFPTGNKVIEKEGPSLLLSLADDDQTIRCQSIMGDLLQFTPASKWDESRSRYFTDSAASFFVNQLPKIKPMPENLFPNAEELNSFTLEAEDGEIARGIGDVNGLYAIEQVFFAASLPKAISHSRNGEMRQWTLDSKKPKPKKKPATNSADSMEPEATLQDGQLQSGAWLPMAGPIAASNDLNLLASNGDYGSVMFFDLKSQREPTKAELGVTSFLLTRHHNQNVLVSITAKNSLTVWNEKGKSIFEQALPSTPTCLAASLDGNLISLAVDGKILVWQIAGQKLIKTIAYSSITPSRIQFSPDGKRLMVYGPSTEAQRLLDLSATAPVRSSNYLALLDIDTGSEIYQSEMGSMNSKLSLSADWKTLALTLEGGPIAVWDFVRGEPKAVLVGHRRPPASLTLSADGRFVFSGGAGLDTYVILWKTPN